MLAATLLALAAAVLHAGWNLLIKTSNDRDLAAWSQYVAGGLLFAPVLLVSGLPLATAPFLAASALVHVGYVEALVRAYHHGDFSFAYPLARGGGALWAAVLGWVALGDALPVGAWVALVVVAAGLMSLVRPGVTRASVLWALATAGTIGIYTVIDSAGARHAGPSPTARFAYGVALTLVTAAAVSVVGVARGRGRAFVAMVRAAPGRVAVSGVLLTGAYSLVLVAVSIPGVQVGYVATLRESSVVLGALAGWLFLHERLGRHRVVSSVVVLVGMAGLIAARA